MSMASLRQQLWDRSFLKRVLRGEGPQSKPVRLDQRRIFILPTRQGLSFAVLLLLMLLGAINYNNSLAYLLTFLLGSVAIVSILHTYRNLAGLTFRAGASHPVFAGDNAGFDIHIDHPANDVRHAVWLRANKQHPVVTDVSPQHTATVSVPLPSTRRGVLPLGRVTIDTRYPLGLFRAWAYVDPAMHTLVYPRPATRAALPPLSPRSLSDQGDQGRGADDFVGFRSYHPGDSLRHVHWKAVARGQGMVTKQFGGDRVEELWLDWDTANGDVENRLSILCRWILDAEASQQTYALRLPGVNIQPGRGEQHRNRCLEALALFDA